MFAFTATERAAIALVMGTMATRAGAIDVRSAPGALHGFPSMSDSSGNVIADGELSQERHGSRLVVRALWRFHDGREARETDSFHVGRELVQDRFSWVETLGGTEQRRFEVDFDTGSALAVVRHERDKPEREQAHLDLPRGRSFAGYGTALAVSELPLERDGSTEQITFVGFAVKPRAVTLEIRRDGDARIGAAGRTLAAIRFTLHPKLPFPISAVVHVSDAHLWFTRGPPRALLRAEQNLVTKDDPMVTIDVIPRGAAGAPSAARRPPGREWR
jgi:hypothetical protein